MKGRVFDSNTYSWVEETTRDTEVNPNIDGERETKRKTDVEKLSRVLVLDGRYDRRAGVCVGRDVCDLSAGKGQEQEVEGTGEFTNECDNVT